MFDLLYVTQNINIVPGLFSAIIMCIIYFYTSHDYTGLSNFESFRKLVIAILFINLLDSLSWFIEGKSFVGNITLSYIVNIFGFILQTIIVIFWVKYAWSIIFKNPLTNKIILVLLYAPILILSGLILTTPLNGWAFYIDSDNFFHRSYLVYITSIIMITWSLFISIAILCQIRFEKYYEQRRALMTLNFFALTPIVATFFQLSGYGISVIWSTIAVSALLIFCNIQHTALSKDVLTTLHNRRSLENYIRLRKFKDDDIITAIVLDLNNFKSINDKYGHKVGDEALIQAANLLKKIFNDSSYFISRYGGDEFVVVTTTKFNDTNCIKQLIKSHCNEINSSYNNKFNIDFSVGCSMSNCCTNKDDFEKLLDKADKKMYEDKVAFYNGVNDRRISNNIK